MKYVLQQDKIPLAGNRHFIIDSFETEVFQTAVTPERYIVTRVKDNAWVNEELALENKQRIAMLPIAMAPILVDLRQMGHVSPEARKVFAKSSCPNVNAVAILTSSVAAMVFANMYMYLNTPDLPTQLFTSEDSAVQWLSKFVGPVTR